MPDFQITADKKTVLTPVPQTQRLYILGFLKSCSRSHMSNPKLLLTVLNISQDPISGIIFILCYLMNIACWGFTYHCSSVPSAHDTTGGKVILITNPYQAHKVVLSARTIQIPKLFHATPWYVSLEN